MPTLRLADNVKQPLPRDDQDLVSRAGFDGYQQEGVGSASCESLSCELIGSIHVVVLSRSIYVCRNRTVA